MTFDSAIKVLAAGKAAKVPSWDGYIFREDTSEGIEEYSSQPVNYKEGDLVTYLYATYVCKIACTGGIWDPECWERAPKFIITFRKRANENGCPSDTPYVYTPSYRDGHVVYDIKTPSYEECGHVLALDGELLKAFQSNDWIVGPAAEFERARIGASNLW